MTLTVHHCADFTPPSPRHSDGSFDIAYDDGDVETRVIPELVRPLKDSHGFESSIEGGEDEEAAFDDGTGEGNSQGGYGYVDDGFDGGHYDEPPADSDGDGGGVQGLDAARDWEAEGEAEWARPWTSKESLSWIKFAPLWKHLQKQGAWGWVVSGGIGNKVYIRDSEKWALLKQNPTPLTCGIGTSPGPLSPNAPDYFEKSDAVIEWTRRHGLWPKEIEQGTV